MKVAFLLCILMALVSVGCTTNYNVVESAPDYITADSLHNSVHFIAANPIIQPGKILSIGNFLFINELYKGWHVIDNTSPSAPINVAFITAPGSLDGTATQSVLYINNSVDLVVLNISDPAHPSLIRRLESVLPVPASPHTSVSYYPNSAPVVGWHDTTVNITFYPMG